MKWFDGGCLWLHEHDSLALLAADFTWGLHIHEFLRRYQVSLSEEGPEDHFLWGVIDDECLENALLSYKHSAEIEAVGLVVLIVDNVSGMVH